MLQKIDLSLIKPAVYNPRYLSDQAFVELKDSIRTLGCIKPIIVRSENNTIIAGHQRTKSMLDIGITQSYAFVITGINEQDEIRFNQLHNMTEIGIKSLQPKISITGHENFDLNTYYEVKPENIVVHDYGHIGAIVNMLTMLFQKYGHFANVVIDDNGNVIISSAYALCCKLLGKSLHVNKIDASLVDYAKNAFSKDYGVFSYDHVPKNTYAQTFAQMNRLAGTQQFKSRLYEFAIPKLSKSQRILDFGAGKMAYVHKLNKLGYNIKGLEFYKRSGNTIDTKAVHSDFKAIVFDVEKNGLFDVVICDSVFNSTDCIEAERSVALTLAALCKRNGSIFFSGRPPENKTDLRKKSNVKSSVMYFCDDNLYTANFRDGYWFYQKFHTDSMIKDLAKFFNERFEIHKNSTSFQVLVSNAKKQDSKLLAKALEYEFSLPLPSGKRYQYWNDHQPFFNKILELNEAE